jgi:hypothetical protein
MVYYDINEYIDAKLKWSNRSMRVVNGMVVVPVDGADTPIPPEQYYSGNSMPSYERMAIPNPDGRNISFGVVSTQAQRGANRKTK